MVVIAREEWSASCLTDNGSIPFFIISVIPVSRKEYCCISFGRFNALRSFTQCFGIVASAIRVEQVLKCSPKM